MSWKLWVVVALMATLALFLVQNTETVRVRLLVWKFETSRALMLLGVLGIGLLGGLLLGSVRRR